jgi:hypothetical protein
MQIGPINLTATPSLGQDGQITWSLCHSGAKCGGPGNYPGIAVAKGSPAIPVTVTINDANHLGISFAPGQDAMWVQPGYDNCPQTYVFDSAGQIPNVTRVSDTQIKFTDLNSNTSPLHLTYRLNFVDTTNKPVTAIDPDIRNGGTNLTSSFDTTKLLLEAAIVSALVALVVSAAVAWSVARRAARTR